MSRRPRKHEHVNHERWLVSYADLVTLLFALFVVLFASSQHDKAALKRVSDAVKNGFQNLGAFSSPTGPSEGPTAEPAPPAPAIAPAKTPTGFDSAQLEAKLKVALGKEIAHNEVALRLTPDGLVISLHEFGFFDSGQAQLLPGASEKIKRIGAVLMQDDVDMRVEGHSDNVPIHNATFDSNWNLSTARATAVAMLLVNDAEVDPKRMSVAGYSEYHPVASNDTPEGRRANRRVDLVVLSFKSPPASAQTP